MALFFAIGLGVGGIGAPYLFGVLIETDNRYSILIGYSIAAALMIYSGILSLIIGIDAENKSLEELQVS